jgi:hypothetical protein
VGTGLSVGVEVGVGKGVEGAVVPDEEVGVGVEVGTGATLGSGVADGVTEGAGIGVEDGLSTLGEGSEALEAGDFNSSSCCPCEQEVSDTIAPREIMSTPALNTEVNVRLFFNRLSSPF